MTRKSSGEARARRYQLFLPLKVWIRRWGKANPSEAKPEELEEESITENISSAGCFFLLSAEPPIGSRVDMEIQMSPEPGGKANSKMVCRGRVVRVEKGRGSKKAGVGCAIERYQIVRGPRQS